MKRILALALCLFLTISLATAGADDPPAKPDEAKVLAAPREKGLDWLTKNQSSDGSWGKTYTIASTSFACLSYLSASDEPFTGDRGKALVKGLNFLLSKQTDGMFASQGRSWIHAQGYGTLALSEAYGRSLFCDTKPDMDTNKLRTAVASAVQVITKNQSTSGGWWYKPKSPQLHEGSTTVCAVQAIVSAKNFGIAIDEKVLEKGFEYLKKCQTEEGGFNYQLGDKRNMKEGTAAGMSTLGLMNKFDNQVMIKAYNFLQKTTPAGISKERFPYYGHFYGCMAMHLLKQEFGEDKEYRDKTQAYIAGVQKDILSWQNAAGSFPVKGSLAKGKAKENAGYSTAYATLILYVPEGKLSIYKRTQPELPKAGEKK